MPTRNLTVLGAVQAEPKKSLSSNSAEILQRNTKCGRKTDSVPDTDGEVKTKGMQGMQH